MVARAVVARVLVGLRDRVEVDDYRGPVLHANGILVLLRDPVQDRARIVVLGGELQLAPNPTDAEHHTFAIDDLSLRFRERDRLDQVFDPLRVALLKLHPDTIDCL